MSIVQEDHKATLRKWHEDLQEKRGARASLRRSKTVNEACLSEGFHLLLMQTHSLWKNKADWHVTALAITAALAAHIKFIDEQKSFAAQLGQKKGGDTPVMSKLRFSHLLAVKTPDELLRQLRRAVKLLDGSVNLFSLADDIFCWCQEQNDLLNHHRRQQRPTEFLRIRWALEYYQAGDGDTDNEQD
ncbi:type I-E CRISPR-associated protein Cse2/CasB [Salmonella enterica]|uniref:type I-E CRISPR-associated protein Cse2/CasB n=1 Tax=Salmonella TaxID=590 RepID=UPI001033ABC8|nr:type I-E CRISPR-associated protein Cse2/CasB [Salmonella enterica]ECE0823963.1 type I-E CRISPR-associated protein Cse2/CasB [Salmonella enterica subsp. enterica]EHN6576456.1 type I-E CRISPR-associated protein Cse2/CasB [Salmonella enterica subsp. enterica serovar Anecho]EDT8815264.1 type I-E CRISPR-associated protein Cse2/CasB [Salmonella enterica subsp. enterica]EDV5684617.1 type I-E CRISPR-associated protein Cse2/CasB [Salmonella enterica subsp. enterica]EFU6704053.1 type I-E CRISPR-assoc